MLSHDGIRQQRQKGQTGWHRKDAAPFLLTAVRSAPASEMSGLWSLRQTQIGQLDIQRPEPGFGFFVAEC